MPAASAARNGKHALAEDREQQQHAAREPPARFDAHQRRNVRVVPRRIESPPTRSAMPVMASTPLGRLADGGVASYRVSAMKYADQKNEAALTRERDVAAGDGRDDPADRGADRQHRRPRRAGERIGRQQLLIGRDVRNRRSPRRFEERRCAPTVSAITAYAIQIWSAVRTSSSPRIRHPRTTSALIIKPAPVHAIDNDARQRPDDGDRKKLHDHHPRDSRGRAREVEQQRVHGDRIEPVAELRDRLADEQQPEVPVPSKERDVRRHWSSLRSRNRSASIGPVSIIVALRCSKRSDTTGSSIGSARAVWARCTARATRGSVARSRSKSSRPMSPTIRIAASVSCTTHAPRRHCPIRTSPRCTRSARIRTSCSSRSSSSPARR